VVGPFAQPHLRRASAERGKLRTQKAFLHLPHRPQSTRTSSVDMRNKATRRSPEQWQLSQTVSILNPNPRRPDPPPPPRPPPLPTAARLVSIRYQAPSALHTHFDSADSDTPSDPPQVPPDPRHLAKPRSTPRGWLPPPPADGSPFASRRYPVDPHGLPLVHPLRT